MNDINFYSLIIILSVVFIFLFFYVKQKSDSLFYKIFNNVDDKDIRSNSVLDYLEKGYKVRSKSWPKGSFIRLEKKGSVIDNNGKKETLKYNELLDELNCCYPFAGLPCNMHLDGNSGWFLHDYDGNFIKEL